MSDVLVAYCSRSGATAAVARRIAERLGADLEEVRPITPYTGSSGFLRAAYQASRGHRPPVAPGRDPSPYRLVIVGSPVWAGCLASPMLTWLGLHQDRLPRVAAFCTSASGSATAVFDQMEQALHDRPLQARLSLERDAVLAGSAESRIDDWARGLFAPPVSAAA